MWRYHLKLLWWVMRKRGLTKPVLPLLCHNNQAVYDPIDNVVTATKKIIPAGVDESLQIGLGRIETAASRMLGAVHSQLFIEAVQFLFRRRK